MAVPLPQMLVSADGQAPHHLVTEKHNSFSYSGALRKPLGVKFRWKYLRYIDYFQPNIQHSQVMPVCFRENKCSASGGKSEGT